MSLLPPSFWMDVVLFSRMISPSRGTLSIFTKKIKQFQHSPKRKKINMGKTIILFIHSYIFNEQKDGRTKGGGSE